MTTTPDPSPALQSALADLSDAMEALDIFARLPLAQQTLAAGSVDSEHPPQTRPFWLAMYSLTNGATQERLSHLVSTLEVGGPELRQALVIIARRAVTADDPRAAVWLAIHALADSVVE